MFFGKEKNAEIEKCETENVSDNTGLHEMRFDYKTILFFAVLVSIFLFASFFNINGSSVGMWNKIFIQKEDTQIIFGTPKAIRSDEWLLHTPAILSQCNSTPGFPTENYSLGGYKAPLIMNVPVKHFSTFFRPQFWPFFLADTERAFAFYWNMKMVFLAGGVFILLMLLLENNFILSVFGALWIYFSGYMQWWYSSPQLWPELVGCFALFTAAFITSITSGKKMVIVAASVIFIVSFFNFVVILYPPHQVPLVYLSFFIVLGVLLPKWKMVFPELLKNHFRLICIILTFVSTAALLILFYNDAKQTLEVLANTVYPGHRRVTGGEMSIAEIFNGFLGIFMSDKNFPEIWGNICESSNFFLLFPVPLMLMGWKWFQQKKVNFLEILLALYIIIILVWMILGFPQPVARISLFNRVTEGRAVLSLGIASIILTCLSLHLMIRDKIFPGRMFRITATVMMLLGILLHSLYFNSVTGNFAKASQIVMVCGFVAVSSFVFVSRQTVLFIVLILLPNIYCYNMINPVRVGLKPLTEHTLYQKINAVVSRDPDSKWVVYGPSFLPNIAYATGARVFNGLKYVPNIDEMKLFSTQKDDVDIYNRYGYIRLTLVKGPEIKFEMMETADRYRLSIDLENEIWNKLDIKYYAFLLSFPDGDHFKIQSRIEHTFR